MSKFSDQISARLKSLGLSAAKAAEQFGVNEAGLRRAIAGKAVPNKRTFGAYAKLLDIGAKEVEALVVEARGAPAKGKGKGTAKAKPAAKGKAKRGSKAKPAKAARGARRGSLAAAVAQLEETLTVAEQLASDSLIRKVASLSPKQRAIVELLLKSI